ncbi:protein-L-isoaspartate O-methyltransferase family protein [Rhodovulum sp. DZ06]|uniref:protein-L-isoaspartate O-methyltransferase family protein n=1 Tax=Rhodovulum sp. DZ06 TaxID=3425126 RepID=UPI003D339609
MIDYEAARIAMVDCQVRPSDVTSFPIIQAMLSVPRERFVPAALRPVCHAGGDLAIGGGRTLLDPRVFAKMLDAADIGPDDLVLDIACGLGYSSAVLARLAAAVVAVESDEGLARHAAQTLSDIEADTAMVENRPLAEGAPEQAPYNVIFINGGLETVPAAIADQLREGGRMVAVDMSDGVGRVCVWTRGPGGLARRRAFDATAPVLDGFRKKAEFVF